MSDTKEAAVNTANNPSSSDYVSTYIPDNVRNSLAAYKNDESNAALENSLFQALYQKDKNLATSKIDDDSFHSYNGMREALNAAYNPTLKDIMNKVIDASGIYGEAALKPKINSMSDSQGTSSDNVAVKNPHNNMPGANTDSSLAILQRR